jgi:hypothetical protein
VVELASGCGPPPRAALRAADPRELDALRAVLAPLNPPPPFVASGRLRYSGPEGTFEGAVEVRVAPPDRAWLQVRTRALFSMVGERVVLALPGDGFLLVYEERADRLERLHFAASGAAAFAPDGRPSTVLEALAGRIPWTGPVDGEKLGSQVRWGSVGQVSRYRLEWPDSTQGGAWEADVEGGVLRRLSWVVGGETRLEVLYERYLGNAGARVPSRVRVRTPRARGEIQLDRVEPRAGWSERDFEVGGNPAPRGGVDGG